MTVWGVDNSMYTHDSRGCVDNSMYTHVSLGVRTTVCMDLLQYVYVHDSMYTPVSYTHLTLPTKIGV